MSRRQWGWIAAIGLSLLYLLVTGKYAYDTDAIGARSSALVSAAAWAVGVLAGVANLIGLLGAVRDSSRSFAIRVINSLAGRLTILALSVALGTVFLVAALGVEPPALWSCSIERKQVTAPDRSRCPAGHFAQMRSFRVQLRRGGELADLPTLRARVNDRSLSSVAIDSDRGGLCVATGPDHPTSGESRLVLSPDCGSDRLYFVNVHLCDVNVIGSVNSAVEELQAAARLEMQEGNHASAIACE